MRAYEIEGWLDGIRIKRKSWDKQYIYYDSDQWIYQNGPTPKPEVGIYLRVDELFDCKDWEIYQEPKQKKAYWLWAFDEGDGYEISGYYYDENGVATDGEDANWWKRNKIKLEWSKIEV